MSLGLVLLGAAASGFSVGHGIIGAATGASSTHAITMGGFEQKEAAREGGARVSLLVSGSKSLIDGLPAQCRAVDGLTGVVYGLSDTKCEIIAEGEKTALEPLAEAVQAAADSADDTTCRQVWQLPVGGYKAFPVVSLAPKMTAKINMQGDAGTMDYISRHLQTEAVFNRGLTLKKSRPSPTKLNVECGGDSGRLKSFVRWCYAGPPLARADEVSVTWQK